ncbi:hypothetical protein MRB53_037451 [Persea americana]|nr:hypothetical protein MRB53_037451 [Persea americana]
MSAAKAQLSCEQCQRRKVKCNKAVPTCSACHAAQISCSPISRQRLPRGRSGRSKNSKASLADRLSRLEGAISQIREGKPPSEASVSSYVAADFWSSLAQAVDEVKEILDDRVDSAVDDQDYDNPTESHDNTAFIFGHTVDHITDIEIPSPTHVQFLDLYKTRFQPMFDTLDTEDLRSLEEVQRSCLNTSRHSSQERKVLTAAVYFGAVCTLLPRETDNKQAMMVAYRLNIEKLLCQANFMTSPTVALLQAFIIYLVRPS